MLGFYIVLPFLLFALYRLFVVLYNYFKRPFLPNGKPAEGTFVSILVYAQNAEKSIGELLAHPQAAKIKFDPPRLGGTLYRPADFS